MSEASSNGAAGSSKLEINKNGRFMWKGRGDTAPAYFPANLGESGDITFRLFLDPSLASTWNGAVSLRFDPGDRAGARTKWLNFLLGGLPRASCSSRPPPRLGASSFEEADPSAEPLILEPATE